MSDTRSANPSGDATARGERLVAIVDDDASVRNSLRRLVSSLGFRAMPFASAAEFLASTAAASAVCLLLDVRMPDMDGLELQRRLGAAGRAVPIVFLTALATDEEERRARAAGAVDFLRKPVPKEKLLDALERALARIDDQGDGR